MLRSPGRGVRQHKHAHPPRAKPPCPDIVGLGWQMLRAILADCFPHLADHLVLPKAIHAVYSFAASEGAVGQEALGRPAVLVMLAFT